MLTKFLLSTVFSCLTVVLLAQPSQALTCGTWNEAEKSIRWWWGKASPQEKILTIEQNGPPRTYSKVQSTNQKKIDEYGNEWEYYQKNPYCSVPAKVKVQQASGPRIFSVSTVFKVSGKKFTFDDVAVGGSEALLQAGEATAPGKDEIIKLVREKLISRIPPDLHSNIIIDKLELPSKPTLSRFGEGQSAWSIDKMNLYMTVDGEKQKNCEIMMIDISKGDVKNKRLDAGGPWNVTFSLKDTPSSCLPFNYSLKVYDFANNIVVQAPPPIDSSWFTKVAGVYAGDIQTERYNEVKTVLTADDGKLSGSFSYLESKKPVSGTISDCKALRATVTQCTWQDSDNDKGTLELQFAKDFASFKGLWWQGTVKRNFTTWDGKKTAETPSAAGAASSGQTPNPSGSTPAPSINKVLKGFGF